MLARMNKATKKKKRHVVDTREIIVGLCKLKQAHSKKPVRPNYDQKKEKNQPVELTNRFSRLLTII